LGGNTNDVFGLPGAGGDRADGELGGEGADAGGNIPTRSAGGSAGGAGATGTAQAGPDEASEPPATIEGCEDTDKVARQLCEAATEEKDPFLRAALWNEYNEYRRILARQ
jgi:hypothetical protein